MNLDEHHTGQMVGEDDEHYFDENVHDEHDEDQYSQV